MKQEYIKKLKSLLYLSVFTLVASAIDLSLNYLALLNLPNEATVILGVVLKEISHLIKKNNETH